VDLPSPQRAISFRNGLASSRLGCRAAGRRPLASASPRQEPAARYGSLEPIDEIDYAVKARAGTRFWRMFTD
jgi:hypothetical protein